jgi:hypothetical protein
MRKTTGYSAVLKKDGVPIWDDDFRVSAKGEAKDNNTSAGITIGHHSYNVGIRTFSIEESGEYQLHVTHSGKREVPIREVEVQVRRNISPINTPIAATGGTMLAAGVILAIPRKKKPSAGR